MRANTAWQQETHAVSTNMGLLELDLNGGFYRVSQVSVSLASTCCETWEQSLHLKSRVTGRAQCFI